MHIIGYGTLGHVYGTVTYNYCIFLAPQNETQTNFDLGDDAPDFIQEFPQSALSLIGLGLFIVLSIFIAYAMEKLYIRLSIRSDSSDMSEHTKMILKASVLGIMFQKKDEFKGMNKKDREVAISKKYIRKWRYNMIQRRNKRKRSIIEMNAKLRAKNSQCLCGWLLCCGKKKIADTNSDVNIEKRAQNEQLGIEVDRVNERKASSVSVNAKSVPNSRQKVHPETTVKTPRLPRPGTSDFVAVEMTMAPSSSTQNTTSQPPAYKHIPLPSKTNFMAGQSEQLADTSLHSDEFNIASPSHHSSQKQDFDNHSSQKYATAAPDTTAHSLPKFLPPLPQNTSAVGSTSPPVSTVTSPKPTLKQKIKSLRPLTAGKSRQIAPGGSFKSPPQTKQDMTQKIILNTNKA